MLNKDKKNTIEAEKLERDKLLLTAAKLQATTEELLKPTTRDVFGGTSGTSDIGSYSYKNIADGHFDKAAKKSNWSQYHIPEDMAYRAFKEQSTGELILDTLSGASKLAVAGFLDMAGSWDLSEISNVTAGNALSDTENWAQNLASNFQESAEKNKIYKNGDSMNNLAYWASQGQQLGYSVGIVGEMLAEQALLAAATQGSGNVAGLASKAKLAKSLLTQGAMGLAGGIRESYMNARETQENVYNKYIKNGFNEELAKEKANEAAHIAYKTEAGSLIVLNTLQNLTLFGGLTKIKPFNKGVSNELKMGFSSFGEELLEKVLPNTTSKLGRRSIQYGLIPAVSEGIEEGIQTTAGAYGEWKVGEQKEAFDPFTVELRDSIIAGGLGGIFLGAGAKAISKFNSNLSNKNFNKEYEEFFKQAESRTYNTFLQQEDLKKQYFESTKKYSKNKSRENLSRIKELENKVEEAQYNSHLATAINALQLDYIKGEGTRTFDSHIGEMQKTLEAVKNKDIEALKKMKLLKENGKERFKGSLEMIADTYGQNIKDSKTIKNSLENSLNNITSDFHSAFEITRKEYINSKHLDKISKINTDLQQSYTTDNYIKQLSESGKERFILENELYALEQIEKDTSTKKLSEEELKKKEEIQEQLQELKYTQKDKRILPNTNRQGYINAEVSKISIGQAIDENNIKLNSLKDLNKIEKKIEKRLEDTVKEATKRETVEKVKEEIEKNNIQSETINKTIEEKETEISLSESINDIDSSGEIIPNNKKIKQNSKKEDKEVLSFSEMLASGKFQSVPTEDTEIDPDVAYSRNLNPEKEYTEQDIQTAKSIISRKDKEYKKEISFEELIIDSIERHGIEKTEDIFNGLKKMFELAGRDTSNSNIIYDKYLIDEISFVESILIEDSIDSIEKQAQKNTERKDNFNVLGQPITQLKVKDVKDSRTNKSEPKIAFNFQEYKRTGDVFTTTSTELKGDNHFILDPEFVNTGDTLIIKVITNGEQKITIYSDSGAKTVTTWGEYSKNIKEDSYAFINRIPMGIYKNLGDKNILVGYVHSADWYTPKNITEIYGKEEQEKIAKKGRENTLKVREEVLNNGGNQTITIKRAFGSYDKINKSNNDTPIKLSKASGDSILARIVSDSKGNIYLMENGSKRIDVVLDTDLNKKVNGKNVFIPGRIADIRYAYMKEDGTKVYMALPTLHKNSLSTRDSLRENLNSEIYNSLKFATLSSIVLTYPTNKELLNLIEKEFNFTLSDAKEIQKEIQENLKINISTNLKNYLELFTRITGNSFLLDNRTKINFKDLKDNFNIPKFKGIFGEKGKLLKTSFNVLYSALNAKTLSNTSIPTIDAQGKVQLKYKGYNSLVKENLSSNVRSHEIKKIDGSKMWVLDIQPTITYSTNKDTVESSIQKASEETIKEIKGVVDTTLNIPKDVLENLSKEDIKLLESLKRTSTNTFNSRNNIEDIKDTLQESIVSGKISSLTDLEFRELTSSLKHKFLLELDFNKDISLENILEGLKQIVPKSILPTLEHYKSKIETFSTIPSLSELTKELESRISKLENIIEEQDKISGIDGILIKEFTKLFGINLREEFSGAEEFDSSNNFKKSFLEKNIKLSYSNKLKLSFFGIKKLRDSSSQEINNDLTQLATYQDADYVENILKSITTEIPSNWDTLMDKFDYKYLKTNKAIFKQLKNKLKDLPVNLKNEILYKLISTRFTAHKVVNTIQKGRNGAKDTYILTVMDENSSKESLKLKNSIRDAFVYNSPITMLSLHNNERILNIEQAKLYKKAFEKYKNSDIFNNGYTVESATKLKDIFKHIGISVSNNTIKEYLNNNNPFHKTQGLLTYVDNQLGYLIGLHTPSKEIVITEEGKNLFDSANKALNQLVDLEIALNGTSIARSIRVAGKTLQGVIQGTSADNTIKELIEEDSELLNNLLEVGYSKKNLLLNQIKENPQLREILSLSFSSPESLKIRGKKSYTDTAYDKLSDTDGLITMLGLYTNNRKNTTLNNAKDIRLGLKFRVGQMPFMTLSDKGRMLYMKTILLEAEDNQISLEEGRVKLEDSILDLLFEQVFESEYVRILEAYSNEDPNIKSFSEASKIFTFLPIFNTLKINNTNIHDIIKYRHENKQEMPSIDSFKEEAKKLLSAYINSEVDNKLDSNGKGIITENNLFKEDSLQHIDSKYLAKFSGTDLEKGRKLFAEHAVNNLLHQVSLYQIFLGDMAYYAKVKGLLDNQGYVNSTKIEENYLNIAETIGQIVDKRSALLIAPGFTLANSKSIEEKNKKHIQLQILDVESISTIIEPLIKASKDNISKEEQEAFIVIKDKNSSVEEKEKAYSTLSNNNPSLKDYFNIEGTDAQEYTTWNTHINILFRQGDLTIEDKDKLTSAYNKMKGGHFDQVSSEELKIVMQPMKPVYTGLIPVKNNNGEVITMRPIYIKSSSFPLLPQVTKNLKIDGLRKNLEALETKNDMSVRASYQTANKIGANKTLLTTEDLYTKSLEELSLETINGRNLLDSAIVVLDTKNFRIQQETPDKTAKYLAKNKDNEISMGSQFWKILMGNGINTITERVFHNNFSKDLLDSVGIKENNMLTGEELDKINTYVFKNFSEAKKILLYDALGLDKKIPFNTLTKQEKKGVFENIVKILKEEITVRNYPEYLSEVLKIDIDKEGEISLESPLFLDSNANKFESLLLSLVSNKLIFHKLPGLGHISTSSEGFERIDTLEAIPEESKQGVVWFNGHPKKLKSTILKNGSISESEVLVKSHYRVTKIIKGKKVTTLIDLNTEKYSSPIIENGEIVGRKLNLEMLDEELLSQFSFRIPTSSHQSGVILKVVGFLPSESADMLIVPAEHTVQLGEDYDIDKRYIYKANYKIEDTGKLSKIVFSNTTKDNIDRLYEALIGEDIESTNKDLKIKIKMYENAMIDIYKSVYQSSSKKVQQKIFKPLSVGVAKETAEIIDKKLNEEEKNKFFSSLSDTYQRKLLKAGADGKGGIGVHSNAVTMEAQMQKLSLENKLQIVDSKGRVEEIKIGNLTSSGVLGGGKSFKTLDGKRDIAEQHGENQNVSTDNINEQIMSKRNENSYTMGVYAIMASRGFDLSLDGVTANNNNPMHIPSLFISQPIIRDYVALRAEQDSISGDFIADKEGKIIETLLSKYNFTRETHPKEGIKVFMNRDNYNKESLKMSGQALYDNLSRIQGIKNNTMQIAVFQKFLKVQQEAKDLSDVQGLINLSSTGLGVSYFETLKRIEILNRLPYSSVKNATKLIGEYKLSLDTAENKKLIKEGYSKVGKYFWKPSTIEGIMLLDSLKASFDLMDIFFPYKKSIISDTIEIIFAEKNGGNIVENNSKLSKRELEHKYEIMREFRYFMNSFNNSKFYTGDINQERRRIFIDTKDNTSLASIIKDIQVNKIPLSNNPFIRNLTTQIRNTTEPSLILHVNKRDTSLESYTEYDGFERMLLDDTTILGTYNGETMTPMRLAQDLISYSLLADSQNGATGFSSLVSVEYLRKIGYYKNIKSNFKASEYSEIKELFIEQYFQHNPDRAKILSPNTIDLRSIYTPNKKIQDSLISAEMKKRKGLPVNINNILRDLKSFEIEGEEFGRYISIRNSSIKNTTNQFNLYRYNENSGVYEIIPVLGTRGMKEYKANTIEQNSILPNLNTETKSYKKGKSNIYYDKGLKKSVPMFEVEKLFPAELGVRGVLEKYIASKNTTEEDKTFLTNLLEYGNLNTKIVYSNPSHNTLGQYNSNTNEIYIHPGIYDKLLSKNNNIKEVAKIVRETIIEEIIHSMTIKEFNKYVNSYNENTGEVTLVENAPIFATKLVSLYKVAKESLPYDSKRHKETYYSQNIYEFMAGMFVAPDYRESLEKANPGLIRKFLDALKDMLGSMYKEVTGKTLSYKKETFNAIYDLLKSRENLIEDKNISTKENIMDQIIREEKEKMTPKDSKSRNIIGRLPEIKKCK